MSKKLYWVESDSTGTWRRIAGAEGTKDYCLGYLAALDSLYPSPRVRVVESDRLDGEVRVIEKGGGRGTPSVNTSLSHQPLVQALTESGYCVSRSEARRNIAGGHVRVAGKTILDIAASVSPGDTVQIGSQLFDVPKDS